MTSLWQDLLFGLRMLRANKSLRAVAVIALALGIGANTAIFSVVNAVLLRTLPYPQPERLVVIRQDLPKLNWSFFLVSPAEWLDYQAGNEVFSEIAGFRTLGLNLTGQDEPQRIQAARVSASLFSVLGVQPLRGRAFSPVEDQVGRDTVAVLSHRLWQSHFNADPAIIGQVVKLDDRAYTVIGVMPPGIQFPHAGTTFVETTELWIPLALTDRELSQRRAASNIGVIGRLKPGVSLQQAQTNITAIASRFQQQHPEVYKGDVQVIATAHSLEQQIVRRVRPSLLVLLGAVGMVLLIACANVANLLLARGAARQKEFAIRRALGAGSLRLIRQLLTESMLLALLGGGGGLLLAVWAVDLIIRFGPENVPRLAEASLDVRVLGFTLLVSLLTGILFGLAPALQSWRIDLNDVLKEGGRGSGGREGQRLRGLLVVFETAAALVLLAGAGLLINSFARLLRVPPGFDPQGALAVRTTLPPARYARPEQSNAVHGQVLEKVAALPGVEAVGAASNLPLTGDWLIAFRAEGNHEEQVRSTNYTVVSPGYFRAMGISLRSGRVLAEQDRAGAPLVVMINEAFARRCWPGSKAIENAVGKRIALGRTGNDWLTVAGVVEDVKGATLDAESPSIIYLPMLQFPSAVTNVIYMARTSVDPASLTALLRREINAADRDLPVYDIQTLDHLIGDATRERRFSMMLLGLLAVAAVLLATIGLYGVMSYTVTQRTREIGIRLALGAQPHDVLKMMVQRGMALTFAGVVIGLGATVALTRLMSGLLFGVSATDPLTLTSVALLLTGVALVACYFPARRAAKVDPMVALRYE